MTSKWATTEALARVLYVSMAASFCCCFWTDLRLGGTQQNSNDVIVQSETAIFRWVAYSRVFSCDAGGEQMFVRCDITVMEVA